MEEITGSFHFLLLSEANCGNCGYVQRKISSGLHPGELRNRSRFVGQRTEILIDLKGRAHCRVHRKDMQMGSKKEGYRPNLWTSGIPFLWLSPSI